MSDSQQPKSAPPTFEVPDLELEPTRPPRRATPAALSAPAQSTTLPSATSPSAQPYGSSNMFDDEAFLVNAPSLDLDIAGPHNAAVHFGTSAGFDALGGLELEGNAQSGSANSEALPRSANHTKGAAWPTGRAPEREQLKIDTAEISLLANYGSSPKSAYLTPGYAYRVFTRQRELRRELAPLEAERASAEVERENALADLARAVRPEAQQIPQFQRLFAPLAEIEQAASAQGQALSSASAERDAQVALIDAELAACAQQVAAEQAHEREAQRGHDEREAAAQRADAKHKRVQIEIRAVTQVAEQKLGPQGGKIPEPEASELTTLRQRAEAVQPEVDQTKAALEQAAIALGQASARVASARQSERYATRKKQAVLEHYQRELELRGRSAGDSEEKQRSAHADLGRAVLAAGGAVTVPDAWLERVQHASSRADALLLRCETHRRALTAYDRARAAQGVRLAGTLAGLVVFLVILKMVL